MLRVNAWASICASTGPRYFKRGGQGTESGTVASIIRFNGAALFQARRYVAHGEVHLNMPVLQRGRAISSAEVQRGNSAVPLQPLLQRGRAISSAEVPTNGGIAWSRHCFNGAALFQARRYNPRSLWPGLWRGFNGAALFQARRCVAFGPLAIPVALLQRGRAISSAEVCLYPGDIAKAERLQRGRAISSAEVLVLAGAVFVPPKSFNGAALFQARRFCRVRP